MRSLCSALVAAALVVACAGSHDARTLPAKEEHADITLHVDKEFTSDERLALAEAADMWEAQTSGLVKIKLVYDLDDSTFMSLVGEHRVYRMLSTSEYVTVVDCLIATNAGLECGSPFAPKLLGEVDPGGGVKHPSQPPVVVRFVADRLESKKKFAQVALHEFGHLIGLPHHGFVGGIMYPSAQPTENVCLKKADLNSFCSIYECGKVQMHPCQ